MKAELIRALPTTLQRRIAASLLDLAFLLGWATRRTAVSIYGAIQLHFAGSSDLHVQETVAQAMVNRCLALGKLDRRAEGIAVCDELVRLFGHSPHSQLRARVAWAMVNKGCFLQELGRDREAVAEYEEVHRRFARAPEAAAAYAAGRRNMCIALNRLGRTSEAAAISHQLTGLANSFAKQHLSTWSGRMIPFVGAAATAFLISFLISIVVYREIPQRASSWLLFPVLYVNHQEHSQVTMGAPPGRFVLVAFISILGILVVRYAIRLPLWVRIAIGAAFGGAFANATEYSVVGSVTDFVGIDTLGVWSIGDICIWLSLLLIAAVGIARPEALAQGLRRQHLLLIVLGIAVVMTVLSGSFVWMKWAGLVYGAGVVGWLVTFALSKTHRSTITLGARRER